MYQVTLTDTKIESWVDLLSISTSMEFYRPRERAIAVIDSYQGQSDSNELAQLTPARMIQIANTYNVEKWLEPAYEALTVRVEVIDEEEAEMIGMRGVLVIMKARETRLREVMRRMREAPVDSGDHATEGKALQVDETRPSDVDSRESCQEDKLLGELHEAAAQSSIDHQGSISAFEYSADVQKNANFGCGIQSAVRHRLYRSEPALY